MRIYVFLGEQHVQRSANVGYTILGSGLASFGAEGATTIASASQLHNMSYSLNSLKGVYIGDYIGNYYRA